MLPLKNGAHANHSDFYNGIRSLPNDIKELGYRACLVNKERINLAENARYQPTKRRLGREIDSWMATTHDRGVQSEWESLRRYPIREN